MHTEPYHPNGDINKLPEYWSTNQLSISSRITRKRCFKLLHFLFSRAADHGIVETVNTNWACGRQKWEWLRDSLISKLYSCENLQEADPWKFCYSQIWCYTVAAKEICAYLDCAILIETSKLPYLYDYWTKKNQLHHHSHSLLRHQEEVLRALTLLLVSPLTFHPELRTEERSHATAESQRRG